MSWANNPFTTGSCENALCDDRVSSRRIASSIPNPPKPAQAERLSNGRASAAPTRRRLEIGLSIRDGLAANRLEVNHRRLELPQIVGARSEERRGGKECVRTGWSRGEQ